MAASLSSSRPTPEHIFQTLIAHQQTAVLKTGIELDVFTAIDEGNHRVENIADFVKTSQRGVRILCDYLTVMGYLSKENGKYSLSPDAALFLSKRSPAYMGTIAEFLSNEAHYKNLARLTEAVKRGGTPSDKGDNLKPNDEFWVSFARSMGPLMVPAALFIADLVRAEEGRPMRVLDIAAGHGTFGITIAKQNRHATVTALDWRAVLQVASENAERAGVADRYVPLPGSAFEAELDEDYDVVLLTNIFHHFDPDTCVRLMKRVYRALKFDGTAVTLEFVPNEDRVTPPAAATFSLQMLTQTDAGDAYTFSEYEDMFQKAGFGRNTLHPIPAAPQQVIVSEK
ncbi:MAG TPA: class I SAM-dependent methyltransferase [Dongiaceae bacterium]|nr:class I SAM-dependent methyltransferase [Dongiaceae bacterium]